MVQTSDHWISNGHVAFPLPKKYKPRTLFQIGRPILSAVNISDGEREPADHIGNAVLVSDGTGLALIGKAWVNQDYLWLTHEICGPLQWFKAGPHDALFGKRAGELRAIVMSMAVSAEDYRVTWSRESTVAP